MKLTLARAAELMQATGDFEANVTASGYSIDSRTVRVGDLFFAVRGERLDGHEFVNDALKNGAAGAVVRRDEIQRFSDRRRILAVDDPLKELQQLAAEVRRIWGRPVVGVTGSAGKTTTKEIVAHILETKYRVLKSHGNLNNHFGMPLQLLKLEPEHDIAVIEMGMSHAGEIRQLARLAQPNCGVVTMVAPVHLEFFDSIAGIARAKYELIEALPKDGVAVINADDEYVSQFGKDFAGEVITFSLQKPADISAKNIELHGSMGSSFDVVSGGKRVRATLPLLGEHSVYNALAGVAVGVHYGIELKQAVHALSSVSAGDKRGEVLSFDGVTVINDCYNSNPKALDSMVRSLAKMPAQRRIVVAGEMLELGPAGEAMHRDCGRHMGHYGIDKLLGVRGLAKAMVEAANEAGVDAEFVETPEDAAAWLRVQARSGDAVLLKASRGVRLERALAAWNDAKGESAH